MYALHSVVVLAAVLAAARAGGWAARRLGQPEVIGEMAVGLLVAPAVRAALGDHAFHAVLPEPVLGGLKVLGEAGLILFLVGLAHRMRDGSAPLPRRTVLWVTGGSLILPLTCGVLLAVWVMAREDAAVRGDAPAAAFVLMVAVSLCINAVPVMARMLTARRMHDSREGRLALSSAIGIDALGWLLLSVAVCLGAGSADGFLRSLLALAFAGVCGLVIRYSLSAPVVLRLGTRGPRSAAVVLGGAAIGVALAVERLGMTSILGAAVVGLSIPGGGSTPWGRAAQSVSRVGAAVVPVFFVVVGVSVFDRAFATATWELFAVTIVLSVVGKGLGGFLGARLGGEPARVSQRVAVLMNTRGLTEIVVIQAGWEAGILTAPLVLVLVVMALVTTAATGPLLTVLDRVDAAGRPSPVRSDPPTLPGQQRRLEAVGGVQPTHQ
ncbi:cation:proton antiporter domain-containing protein [Streptomyces sp. NPDC004069]